MFAGINKCKINMIMSKYHSMSITSSSLQLTSNSPSFKNVLTTLVVFGFILRFYFLF